MNEKIKYKNYTKLFLFLIVIATFFMGIGYATINSIVLEFSGTASALAGKGIYISTVKVDDINTINGLNISYDRNGTFLTTSIALANDKSSKLTLLVNVCNNNLEDVIFNSLKYLDDSGSESIIYPGSLEFSNLYSNREIVIENTQNGYSSLYGTILSSKQCMDIPITFKYDDTLTSITNNKLDITMNLKFDTLETYKSNIEFAINSTTGTFENYNSRLNYEITIKNNNTYPIKFNTTGTSTSDIILSGASIEGLVTANSSVTTTLTLAPAKNIYESDIPVTINIGVKVPYPIEIDERIFTISVTTYGTNLKDIILSANTVKTTTPSYAQNVTTAAASGLFKTTDESGTTYYFRGVVTNNYVKFANLIWRIVRINGDGTYRIILNKSAGTSVFSTASTNNYNVGFMYGTTVRANTSSSTMKTYLENWYTSNLQNYDSYIDKDAIFWQDRTLNTTNNVYAGWTRVVNNSPSLVATNVNDMFSVTTSKGNGKLTKPIGLITADEIVLAGGTMTGATASAYGTYYENRAYYIYTGDCTTYGMWTLTPRRIGANSTLNHLIVSKEQAIIYSEPPLSVLRHVKPVINLKANTRFKGTGTKDDPYVVY